MRILLWITIIHRRTRARKPFYCTKFLACSSSFLRFIFCFMFPVQRLKSSNFFLFMLWKFVRPNGNITSPSLMTSSISWQILTMPLIFISILSAANISVGNSCGPTRYVVSHHEQNRRDLRVQLIAARPRRRDQNVQWEIVRRSDSLVVQLFLQFKIPLKKKRRKASSETCTENFTSFFFGKEKLFAFNANDHCY